MISSVGVFLHEDPCCPRVDCFILKRVYVTEGLFFYIYIKRTNTHREDSCEIVQSLIDNVQNVRRSLKIL